jgi:hypothetical protein
LLKPKPTNRRSARSIRASLWTRLAASCEQGGKELSKKRGEKEKKEKKCASQRVILSTGSRLFSCNHQKKHLQRTVTHGLADLREQRHQPTRSSQKCPPPPKKKAKMGILSLAFFDA